MIVTWSIPPEQGITLITLPPKENPNAEADRGSEKEAKRTTGSNAR